MKFVGIDLHKNSITLCVVNQDRNVFTRKRFLCAEPSKIEDFFAELGSFQAVMEATASYEWLWKLLEPMANRLLLAHPRKMRIIAESTRKSDKYDAKVLAEFLALDMIPQAHHPSPRQKEHRRQVRHRHYLRGQQTSVRNKIRHIIADYNADRPSLFTGKGLAYLAEVKVSAADRFVIDQLLSTWRFLCEQLDAIETQLREFAKKAPASETEARKVLETIPGVGTVTVDVVVSELGDIERFRSAKKVCAYAGLNPGYRESDGKGKDLGITKEGSRYLRWVMIEAAWQIVRRTRRWGAIFEALAKRRGKKRAIVAIARRLLCVMKAMLCTGRCYQPAFV